jgi:hypothetical protein
MQLCLCTSKVEMRWLLLQQQQQQHLFLLRDKNGDVMHETLVHRFSPYAR